MKKPLMHPRSSDVIEGGNINLNLSARPKVSYKGGTATVNSMSFRNNKGEEVLIPKVVGKRVLPDREAKEHYGKTGQHLGKFKTPQAATKYAERVHRDQERQMRNQPRKK